MEYKKDFFEGFLNDYNKTWYDKDIEELKSYYDLDSGRLIYYDNHKGNDTYTVDDHIALIFDLFTNGKQTESGEVEELMIEDFNVFSTEDAACLCFITKYKSYPEPHIRATMYIQRIRGKWKVMHVHCSFSPDK